MIGNQRRAGSDPCGRSGSSSRPRPDGRPSAGSPCSWPCSLALSGLNVVNSYVGRDFMTAISDAGGRSSSPMPFVYVGVFAVSTIMAAFYRFSEERLRLLWRAWLTRLLIDLYMSRDRFYRLKARDEVDNPDERITEDVKSYTQTTLSFFLMSLNAVITSLAFLGVLWSITPGAGAGRPGLRGGRLGDDDPAGPSRWCGWTTSSSRRRPTSATT